MAVCEHLAALERELIDRGIKEYSRGQTWSRNCRGFVYFACCLDQAALRKRLHLNPCVEDHENADPRSGTERGLVCSVHHDGIIGALSPSTDEPLVG